jgi:hypothetical protein
MTPQQAAALTDEEVRVKIAELDEWKWVEVHNWVDGRRVEKEWSSLEMLPNYPQDLNAIFEAENAIIEKQPSGYARRGMMEAIDLNITIVMRPTCGTKPATRATARQRCEALLVTMSREGGDG